MRSPTVTSQIGLILILTAAMSFSGVAGVSPGSPDRNFNPGAGPDGEVRAVLVQEDGKILAGGTFKNFTGVGRTLIARLFPDGSLDPSFVPIQTSI